MNQCRYIFQKVNWKVKPDGEKDMEVTPLGFSINGLTRGKFIFELFESNVDPMIRMSHKRKIEPSGWVKVTRNNGPNMSSTNCDIAFQCPYTSLFPVLSDGATPIGPISVCAFDIECTSSHGDFPQAQKSYDTPARQIVDDIQRLYDTVLSADEWGHSCTQKNATSSMHKEFAKQYILHIFGLETNGKLDLSRIHRVNTIGKKLPTEKTINLVVKTLMSIQKTSTIVLKKREGKKEKKTSANLSSFAGFINAAEPNRVSDIFINCKSTYADKGIPVINAIRQKLISTVTGILDAYLPKIEGDAIVQVSNCFLEYGKQDPSKMVLLTLGECGEIPDYTVVRCKTEIELILEWTKMVQKEDPDMLAGYNSFGFDLPYLYDRAEELGILDRFQKLSKLSDKASVLKEKRLSSAALGDNIWRDVPIIGRIHVDIMKVVQRDHNLTSYSLDSVASHFMNGKIKHLEEVQDAENTYTIHTNNTEGIATGSFISIQIFNGLTTDLYGDHCKFKVISTTPTEITVTGNMVIDDIDFNNLKCNWCSAKDDMLYTEIFDAFNTTDVTDEVISRRATIGRYCMKDSILCIDLVKKLEIVGNNIGMSNVCSVPLSWIFSRGQGAKTLSLVVKRCSEEGFLVPVSYMSKNDPEYEGAIVLDPEPGIYLDEAVAVLDYSSLYPSCIISENMSHDSIVFDKKWKGEEGGKRLREMGYDFVDIEWNLYKTKGSKKNKIGTEVTRYVQFPNNEKGIIPKILMDLLSARKNTRKKIKYRTVTLTDGRVFTGLLSSKNGQTTIKTETGDETFPDSDIETTTVTYSAFQQGILDGLQLAYKITANSIYGQMGAKTSPVKMIPIAACTTATGRDLLMMARDKISAEYRNKEITFKDGKSVFVKNAITVYGDTDSVFIKFSIFDKRGGTKLTGKELLAMSIQCGLHSSSYAAQFLKKPHDLEYEKTFFPFILISKKRYTGMKYEFSVDKCKQTSMGIVLKRRDNAKILKFVFGGVIDIIMKDRDIQKAYKFVQESVKDIVNGKYGMDYLVITKSLRTGYKNPDSIAHKVLADRMGDRDPGNRPKSNDRIPYVYIVKHAKKGEKILQGNRIETPDFITKNELEIDYQFYITNQIAKPVSQVFALMIRDLPGYRPQKKMLLLQKELRKSLTPKERAKTTLKLRSANEKYASELLFSKSIRLIRNKRKGQKEITHFMNIKVPLKGK